MCVLHSPNYTETQTNINLKNKSPKQKACRVFPVAKNVQGHGQSKPDISSRLDTPPERLDVVTPGSSWEDGKVESAHSAALVHFLLLLHLLHVSLANLYTQTPKARDGPKTNAPSPDFWVLFPVVIFGRNYRTGCGQRRSGRPCECIGGIRVPTGSFHKHGCTLEPAVCI